ncbi:MAG TPA: type II secretion system protein [Solirubrobacteraceae bacterium]|nr:type II secretion system protein [Solirubrobacteraceae bacterium]
MLSKLTRRVQDEKGFTLIELLVVILIIGILAAVAIPTFLNQRGKAYDSNAQSQVKTAQLAEETYATNNNGNYTTTASDLTGIEPSLSDTSSATFTVNAAPTGSEYQVVSTAAHTGDSFTITESNTGTETNTCSAGTGGQGSPGTCPASHTW